MKILVTGAAGYIGSVLVPILLEAGYAIRALDLPSATCHSLEACFLDPQFEFQRGDIREEEVVAQALHGIDHIMHLAAVVGYPSCEEDLSKARSINVGGTVLLGSLRNEKQRLIFPSTLGSYSQEVGQVATEEATVLAKTSYGILKLEAERKLLEFGNVTIFRPASAFGLSSQMRFDSLMNYFVYKALKDRCIELYEPQAIRPVIHIQDLSRAFLWVLQHLEETRDQIFHVGHETLQLSKWEMVERIQKKTGCELRLVDGKDQEERYFPIDFSKIRQAGYKVTVTFEEGVEELLQGLSNVAPVKVQGSSGKP